MDAAFYYFKYVEIFRVYFSIATRKLSCLYTSLFFLAVRKSRLDISSCFSQFCAFPPHTFKIYVTIVPDKKIVTTGNGVVPQSLYPVAFCRWSSVSIREVPSIVVGFEEQCPIRDNYTGTSAVHVIVHHTRLLHRLLDADVQHVLPVEMSGDSLTNWLNQMYNASYPIHY